MPGQRSLLMIFYRNPEKGKVKTRLAATIGEERALHIYEILCDHTLEITRSLSVDKSVYYSERIEWIDRWPATYRRFIQSGMTLGERMSNAFHQGFQEGYTKICIIGTDCYELSEKILSDAFARLDHFDAVTGPARDGGYYLLGLKAHHPSLFRGKKWGTSSVLGATLEDFRALGIRFHQLPWLSDVDEEADLPAEWREPGR